MNLQKLRKLKRELADLIGSPRRAREIEAVAGRLGRKPTKGGDHGRFWISEPFPHLDHFDIPRHSKPCGKGVVAHIAGILESQDIPAWEQLLGSEEDQSDEEDKTETIEG